MNDTRATQAQPRTPEEAAAVLARSDRLRAWMSSSRYQGRPISQQLLIQLTGLADSIVSGLMSRTGQYRDLAGMRSDNISRLVDGMRKVDSSLTGESIAQLLDIPRERWDRWIGAEGPVVTVQPATGQRYGPPTPVDPGLHAHGGGSAPLLMVGPVTDPPDVQPYMLQVHDTVPLRSPLQGAVTAPAGWSVTLGPDSASGEVLWLLGGQPWALPAGVHPGAGCVRLGSIRTLRAP